MQFDMIHVGPYTITRSVVPEHGWLIRHESGEGMVVPDKTFLKLIDEFFAKEF